MSGKVLITHVPVPNDMRDNVSQQLLPRMIENRSVPARLVNLSAALAISFVLLLSFWLKPDPRGLGTHEQLMLYPCNFYVWTGYPCPTCGMTTAFAHMAHGQLREAFVAQPMGALGFLVCVCLLPITAISAFTGTNLVQTTLRLPWRRLSMILGAMLALSWIFKLVVFMAR
jgi:hypothetical protein